MVKKCIRLMKSYKKLKEYASSFSAQRSFQLKQQYHIAGMKHINKIEPGVFTQNEIDKYIQMQFKDSDSSGSGDSEMDSSGSETGSDIGSEFVNELEEKDEIIARLEAEVQSLCASIETHKADFKEELDKKMNDVAAVYDERLKQHGDAIKKQTRLEVEHELTRELTKSIKNETEQMYKLDLETHRNKVDILQKQLFQQSESERKLQSSLSDMLKHEREQMERKHKEQMDEKMKMMEEHTNLKHKMEIERLKQHNEELERANKTFKEENDAYHKKYDVYESNATTKGTAFEEIVEEDVKNYSKENGNVWNVERISSQAHKGDFRFVNRYNNNITIMVECKHMDVVSATHKEQQPKFIRDVTNPDNKYGGAIMTATGSIAGKYNGQIEIVDSVDGKKVVGYICYYTSNRIHEVFMMMNMIYRMIQFIKNDKNNNFDKQQCIEYMIKQYERDGKQHKYHERQMKEIETNMKETALLFQLTTDNKTNIEDCIQQRNDISKATNNASASGASGNNRKKSAKDHAKDLYDIMVKEGDGDGDGTVSIEEFRKRAHEYEGLNGLSTRTIRDNVKKVYDEMIKQNVSVERVERAVNVESVVNVDKERSSNMKTNDIMKIDV